MRQPIIAGGSLPYTDFLYTTNMLLNEKILTLAKYHADGIITDGEYVTQFIREILDGELNSIAGLMNHIPKRLEGEFLRSIAQLENDDYVDTYPFNRVESIDERQKKAKQLKHQYKVVFAELRAFFEVM